MNIIPLPLLDGDSIVMDNSTMELMTTCPRSALYGICLRRRGTKSRIALQFGGVMHKVLEHRYKSPSPMLEQTDALEKEMFQIAAEEFHGVKAPGWTEETPLWTKPPIEVPPDDYRNYDRMVDLIHNYGIQYPFEPFELIRFPDGRPFVEVPFVLPLGEIRVDSVFLVQDLKQTPDGSMVKSGEPHKALILNLKIIWMGKIDLAYRHSGGVYLLDHKSSSMDTNMAEFEISHQFKGYEWATEQIIGEPVVGTVINRVVCRKPTRTGIPFTFTRKPITSQRGLVEEWKTDVLHILADYVEMNRRQYFPKHTSWCVGKFGTCQFHQVCSLGEEPNALSDQRRIILDSGEYEDNTWSPLKESS